MPRAAPDIALVRFLRAGANDTGVLNAGAGHEPPPAAIAPPPGPTLTGAQLAQALLRAARALTLPADGGVPYAAVARLPAFAAYRALTKRLPACDPASLTGRATRTAFWINLYNALVIDAVISFGVSGSVREAAGFFHRAAYRVGPYRFSLNEIEHGLLRNNRPALPGLPPPFPPGDPRAALGPGALDPRIHFALNCGARSCPAVAFYDGDGLDAQLESAAVAFVNGDGVRREGGGIVLSPVFAHYADDFGGADGVVAWTLRYLTDPSTRALLAAGAARYGDYDWSLNRG